MKNTQQYVPRVEVSRRCFWSGHPTCRLVTGTVVPLRNKSNWVFISVSQLLRLPVRKLVCSVSFPQMTDFLPYCYCFNMISFPILCCFLHPPLPSAEDPAPSQRVHTDSQFSIQHNWGRGNLHRGCEKRCWQQRNGSVRGRSSCHFFLLQLFHPEVSFLVFMLSARWTACVPLL